jgi:hypothetical protein
MFIGKNQISFFLLKIIFVEFSELVKTKLKHALTGNIAFNDHGDRIESLYEIINIQDGQPKVVGTYRSNTVSIKYRFY